MKVKTISKRMPDGQNGFAVRAVATNRMDFEDICRAASQGTGMSQHEITLAVELLAEAVRHYLQRGVIVDLGPIGIVHPGVRSGLRAVDNFTWHDVKPTVTITPDRSLVRAAKSGKIRWIGRADDGEK